MSSCQGAGWSCECALWPGLEVYLLRTANERGWWFWLSNKCSKFWRSSSGSSNRQIDQYRHVTSSTKTSMSIIVKPQGFSINRCLRSLPVPCLPRGLFLHQEEWVFFLFLNKWYQGLAQLFFLSQSKCQSGRDDTTRCPNQQLWKIDRTWNSMWEKLFCPFAQYFLSYFSSSAQFYATVQRQKNPGLTPFSSGYEVDASTWQSVIKIWLINKINKINHSIQGGHHRAAQAGSSLSGKI